MIPFFSNFLNKLRQIPIFYRLAMGFRRCFIPALKDAFWQFYRSLANSIWFCFHSTDSRRKRSALSAFMSGIGNGPPFRLFSVYQALRCGWPKFEGRIVLEDQGAPKVLEGSLAAGGTTQQHNNQPWPIFWSRHSSARLVSSSLALVTPEKELCVESVFGYQFFEGDPAVRYFSLPPPVKLAGNWTSIVSRWVPTRDIHPNHSHWLLEALPRLALLSEFPADTRIIVPARLAKYQRESLAMLGLTESRLRYSSEEHLQIENYYFSAPPSMIACYSPYAVKFLRDTFLPKADPDFHGPKRFFITRRNVARNVANNADIEAYFSGLGWGVVDLCELTFAQEIRLFAEAEAVFAVGGSGLTNILFSRPECAVLAVGHDYWTDGVLDWLIETVGITKYNVHIAPTDECRQFSVDMEVLKRQLESEGFLP